MERFQLDDNVFIECSIKDSKPKLKVLGEFTTINFPREGKSICCINEGEFKYHEIDKCKDIEIVFHSVHTLDKDERVIEFYGRTKSYLVYFNLTSHVIVCKDYPRGDK